MSEIRSKKLRLLRRLTSICILITFLSAIILPVAPAQAQSFLNLPLPGTMVNPSPAFVPVLLRGMTIHPEDPLRLDFILDSGNSKLQPNELQGESERLVKYFLASMTVPNDDLWVNLSPYEQDRIIPEELGKTELGRDMLAQDYILKQLTASLIYPEEDIGKKFWDRVYKKAREQFHTTEIPTNAFNKVWILPQEATVYENGHTVYIVNSRLKVMLDEDYVAKRQIEDTRHKTQDVIFGSGVLGHESPEHSKTISSQIVREIILPEIEREVNEGENFAPLRQIYHSLILAKWYKETIKENLLTEVFIDKNKISGIDLDDKTLKDKIYQQYIEAYKKGVFAYIREDYDQLSQEVIPRKYFSGGEELTTIPLARTASTRNLASSVIGETTTLALRMDPQFNDANQAMLAEEEAIDLIKVQLESQYHHLIQPEHIQRVIELEGEFNVDVVDDMETIETFVEGPAMETSEFAPPGPYTYRIEETVPVKKLRILSKDTESNKAMLGYNDADFEAESAWLHLIKTEKNYVKTHEFDVARNRAIEKTGASVVPDVYIVGKVDDRETFGAIYSPDEERIYVQEALIRRINDTGNRADMKTRIFIYLLTKGSQRDKRKAEYEYAKEVEKDTVNNLLPRDRANGQTFDDVIRNVRDNIVGIDMDLRSLRAKLGLEEDVKFVNEDDFVFETNSKQLLEIGENSLYTIAINALNGKIDLNKHFRIEAKDQRPPSSEVKVGMLAFAANPFTDAHYLIATLKAMALSEVDTFFVSPTKGDFRKPALEATYKKRLALAQDFFENATGGLIRVMPALPQEEGDGNGINGEEKVIPLLEMNKEAESVDFYYAAGADHFYSFARDDRGKVKFAKIAEGDKGNKKDFDYYVGMRAYPELLRKLLVAERAAFPEEHIDFIEQLSLEDDAQKRLALVKDGASFPVLDVIGKLYLIQQELAVEAGDNLSKRRHIVMLNTSRGDQPIDKLRDRMNFPTFFNRGVNIHIAATRIRNGIARLLKRNEFDLNDLGFAPEDLLVEFFKPKNREYLYSLIRIKGLKFDEAYEFSNSIDVLLPIDSDEQEDKHQQRLAELRSALQRIDASLNARAERDKERDVSVVTVSLNGEDILRYEYTVKNGISDEAGGDNTFLTKAIDVLAPDTIDDLKKNRAVAAIENYIKQYNSAKSLIERFPRLNQNDIQVQGEGPWEKLDDGVNPDVLMIPANYDLSVFARALDFLSKGIGKRLLISGGHGYQAEVIKTLATKNGITLSDDSESEAEMIRDIMAHMARNHRPWSHIADDLYNPEKTILEETSSYTVENFRRSRDVLKEEGIIAPGKRPTILYMRSPLQQLRAKGAFESVFKDEDVEGISFTVDYLQEPDSVREIIGEYFRIIANAQKIDPETGTPDWDMEGGLSYIPDGEWKSALELLKLLKEPDGWRDTLVANLYRMGHNRESLFKDLPSAPAALAKAIMDGPDKAMLGLSEAELELLNIKADPDSKHKRDDRRIKKQVMQIEIALERSPQEAQEKAGKIIEDLDAGRTGFKGEEVHILNGTGAGATAIGRIDRKIAETYGYIHETANVILLDPDGKIVLQLRNKDNYDDHLAAYGGHLAVGESHIKGAQEEASQETGLSQFATPMTFIGYEGYDVPQDNNRERRSWFVQRLTKDEWERMKVHKAMDEKEVGASKAKDDRDTYKRKLSQLWPDGKGEVTFVKAFSLYDLKTAEQGRNPESKLKRKNSYLEVTEEYQGKRVVTRAFFTPDSLDLLVKNAELWDKIETITLVEFHHFLAGAGTADWVLEGEQLELSLEYSGIMESPENVQIKADFNQAMLGDMKGGIDLNDINVKREGVGVDIEFAPQDIEMMTDGNINGFVPVIINLTPLPSILPLLGLSESQEEPQALSLAR